MLLILVVLVSAGSGVYAGASFYAQQGANVTVTTTIYTTTTSWTASTIWSTVTEVVQGVLTTVEYTTSTSTITVTGSTSYRTGKIVTANGDARIGTAQSKFGGASGLFGGGGYLSTPDSADWFFGTGDFTIDFWVRFNALPAASDGGVIVSQFVDVNHWWEVLLGNNAGTYQWIFYHASPGATINFHRDTTVSTGTWYHLALVRSGNNWYFFQDGSQLGTAFTSSTSLADLAAALNVGRRADGYYYLNGRLDELCISKGVARWTGGFTPSTAPCAPDLYAVLLLHMDGTDGSTSFIDG
jgi:hypothetical protein